MYLPLRTGNQTEWRENELSSFKSGEISEKRSIKNRRGDGTYGKASPQRGHRQRAHAAQLLLQKIGGRAFGAMEKGSQKLWRFFP